ncbi:hypothetical protein J6590_097320 [Homalodisca vitripennis]|nr:hypothetical protein J6590_097320 [Homalodisca vitripennis]
MRGSNSRGHGTASQYTLGRFPPTEAPFCCRETKNHKPGNPVFFTYLGDVSEKICSASIKTDPNITALTVCNKNTAANTQSPCVRFCHRCPGLGLRPTLLHLLRLHLTRRLPAPRLAIQILHIDQFTGGRDYCVPRERNRPLSLQQNLTCSLLQTHSKRLRLSPRREPLMLTNLRQKNCRLKEQIRQLNVDLMRVVDHSIESDTRLLRYTNDIFLRDLRCPEYQRELL